MQERHTIASHLLPPLLLPHDLNIDSLLRASCIVYHPRSKNVPDSLWLTVDCGERLLFDLVRLGLSFNDMQLSGKSFLRSTVIFSDAAVGKDPHTRKAYLHTSNWQAL